VYFVTSLIYQYFGHHRIFFWNLKHIRIRWFDCRITEWYLVWFEVRDSCLYQRVARPYLKNIGRPPKTLLGAIFTTFASIFDNNYNYVIKQILVFLLKYSSSDNFLPSVINMKFVCVFWCETVNWRCVESLSFAKWMTCFPRFVPRRIKCICLFTRAGTWSCPRM
jgi:hypothetical protein